MAENQPISNSLLMGQMLQRLNELERDQTEIKEKLDEILAIKNRGVGALWVLSLIMSGIGYGISELIKRHA